MKSVRELISIIKAELAVMQTLFPPISVGPVRCDGFTAEELELAFQTEAMYVSTLHEREQRELREKSAKKLERILASLRQRKNNFLSRMAQAFAVKAERINVYDMAKYYGLGDDEEAQQQWQIMKASLAVILKINNLLVTKDMPAKARLEAASVLYHEGLNEVAGLRDRFERYCVGRMQAVQLLRAFDMPDNRQVA